MNKVIDPSPEQMGVIEASESQIVVIAAAGAGKTMVLVKRYLRHVLLEGINPDRILTITFTRKAAAEMKGRIVAGLREVGAYDAAQIAETGPIQTIHALCEQLLRENAISAGVDAQFEIISGSQSDRLQMESVEEALATVDLENPDAEALISNLTGKRTFKKIDSPYALLQQSIKEALEHLRGSGLSFQEVWETYHNADSFRARYREALLAAQPEDVRLIFAGQTGQDWRENLKLAWKIAPKAAPVWIRNALPILEEEMTSESETCGVAQFALEAWSILESKMEQLQKFDFSYLEDRALRLIRSSPAIQEELGQKFEIVMVDEAQDLNRKQHGLIEVLGLGRKLTVGDGQQSIYGFRHADLELFRSTQSETTRRLSRNYRAAPGILNFVDRVFGVTWPDHYVPMQAPKEFDLDEVSEESFEGVEYWEMPPGDIRVTASYIRRMIEEGDKPGDICVLARSSNSCQTIHEALTGEGVESRIHGGSAKFYTRMEVHDLANILRALADPYNDFALLATLRSPAVEISVEGIFRLGLHPPVLDTMRETQLSTDDRRKLESFLEWFDPMREYADRLSAWEVMSKVFSDTPFLAALGRKESSRRQIENVRKLLILASQDSHLGPLEFADQIREIQQLRHKEGDAEEVRDQQREVRLMTIHKAKGLEFPIVVLPDTNQDLGGGSKGGVLFDLQLRLMAAQFGKSQGLLYRYLADRKKDRELSEELRVLYVAMTRAEQKLCIGIFPPTSKDTVSKRIIRLFGDSIPESIRVRKPIQLG